MILMLKGGSKMEYLDLFWTFFKLGLFTLGGGYAMIGQLKDIVVEKKKWITEEELLEICAIAESTPGPVAINLSTCIGYRNKKLLGSIVSTIGVVLPSFIIIFIISLFLASFMQNIYVQYAFIGINACVAFLIIKAGVEMFINLRKSWWQILLTLVVITLMILFELYNIDFSSIYLILIGAFLGILIISIQKGKEEKEKEDVK